MIVKLKTYSFMKEYKNKGEVVMKKISKFMKNNKVETGLYTITLLCVMELLVTGRILIEYDKGGSIKSLLDKK